MDKEIRVLELEDEINELQITIDHYKDLVLEKHREALSWETKYKLIEETLRWRKGEEMLTGEIGNMKKEIHRMQIRHNQLKRAQEKLVQDLEHCVMHREQIFFAASTKQRAEAKPQRSKSSITARQKVNDLRNKLKHVQNEIDYLKEHDLITATQENEGSQQIVKKIREDIERETNQDTLIRNEIEEHALLKHRNLDDIVRRQNRTKAYRKLNKINLTPKIPRSETVIQGNIEKQTSFNDNLTDAIQTMMTEIPMKKNFFLKIFQSLKD